MSSFYKQSIHKPSIYQLEVTNDCNFHCNFCLRRMSGRKTEYLDLALAKKIAERDLDGSNFIEFQMSGEPLMHPNLETIISYFKGKVLTGLSTNGSLIAKQLPALLNLDYLTVSVDSITDYDQYRSGGSINKLLQQLGILFTLRINKPIVDLQIVELKEGQFQTQLTLLQDLIKEKGWEGHINSIRKVDDCFVGWLRPEVDINCNELCLNPWFSVSIHADGDVVPCCLSFSKRHVFGNLLEKDLATIWAGSEVEEFREDMRRGGGRTPAFCRRCYMRSPYLLHETIVKENFWEVKDVILGSNRTN